MNTEIIRAIFPIICILATIFLSRTQENSENIQIAIMTAGATAYQQEKRNDH